ncbi:MAG: 4Fe-4S dicluster domain-containing protein, partial [Actinomycetota bacterium]
MPTLPAHMAMTDTQDPADTTPETGGGWPSASRIIDGLGVVAAASVLLLWWLGTLPAHPEFRIGRVVFGNVPEAVVALFYGGVAAGLWLAIHLFALRARGWERGGRERRTGLWRERIRRLDAGLRMKTLMRDRSAGLMHSMVYYGFLVLFAGTVTLEIDHLLPAGLKFLHGPFYQGYSAVLDLAGVVFLAGLAWAAARRYLRPPWRIRSKTKPEDGWILATLALIGITGFTTEAARIALVGRPDFEVWSFVGMPLSYLVPAESASIVHQTSWVVHAVAFVAFLVVLPTTKLRHMFTSPANLFLQPRERPKGAMREMPNLMEVEDIDTIGASVVDDLTWKQIFDTDACTICGRCTSVCPANITGKPLDPREMVLKTGEVAAAAAGVSPPVGVDERISLDGPELFARVEPVEAWSCTTCKACDEICPV